MIYIMVIVVFIIIIIIVIIVIVVIFLKTCYYWSTKCIKVQYAVHNKGFAPSPFCDCLLVNNITWSRDSVVSVASGYGRTTEAVGVRVPVVKNFLFPTWSRPALGPTQLPIQWVQGALSLGIKRQGRERLTTHFQSVPRTKKCGSIQSLPHTPSWRNASLVKDMDNFTFALQYGIRYVQGCVSSISIPNLTCLAPRFLRITIKPKAIYRHCASAILFSTDRKHK
jgi:hypothetical protein